MRYVQIEHEEIAQRAANGREIDIGTVGCQLVATQPIPIGQKLSGRLLSHSSPSPQGRTPLTRLCPEMARPEIEYFEPIGEAAADVPACRALRESTCDALFTNPRGQ